MKIQEAKIVRELSYKIIFSSLFLSDKDCLILSNFWTFENDNLRYNKENILDFLKDEKEDLSEEAIKLLFENLDNYIMHLEYYKKLIQSHLKENFSFDKVAKSDLAIIYLSIIELQNNKDLSEKIIINEAIELAKKYSSEKAYKFVNGILSNIVKEIRK